MTDSKWSSDRLHDFFASLATRGPSAHVAGLIEAPFNRVKLILQAQQSSSQITPETRYTGAINALARIPKEQGIQSFWRGYTATIPRFYIPQILNYVLKDRFKKLTPAYNPSTDFGKFFVANMASGMVAGVTTLLLVYPLDLARTRLALDVGTNGTRQFTGLWDCLSSIYKQGGISSLYNGFAAASAGILVYRAAYFGLYDLCKKYILDGRERPNYFYSWLVAQSVTLLTQLVTYPIDTVRQNMAMQAGSSEIMYTGNIDCARKLYATGGIQAFFGGWLFTCSRSITGAFILVAYDVLKRSYNW